MGEMDYSKITIKELTVRARINRRTFYLHYSKLEDLLREIQIELMINFSNKTKGLKKPRDTEKITRIFFNEVEKSGKLGEKIVCDTNNEYILNTIRNGIMEQYPEQAEFSDGLTRYKYNIVLRFLYESTYAIYRQWVADGKKIPLEDVIELAISLVCTGSNSWKEP